MIARILVATDFSDLGNAAALRAAELAKRHSAALRCVHAMPGEVALRSIFNNVADSVVEGFRDATHKQGESLSAQLSALRGVPTVVECLEGTPHRVVMEAAEECDPDLLVAGAHGQGVMQQLFLGGTISKLMAAAECPVLIVRQAQQRPYASVVAAVDLQGRSAEVVASALAMTTQHIEVFHAVQSPLEYRMRMYGVSEDVMTRLATQHRDHQTGEVNALIAASTTPDQLSCRIGNGHPNTAVLEALKLRAADLLVIGKHGGGRLAERVLGSVPKFLAYNAPCDILIV